MEFVKGHKYLVNSPRGNKTQGGINYMEKGFVFVYERKEGKHYMFRELIGGWLRTYTDNQLKGKTITEA